MTQSNDIPALYQRCIARDSDGHFMYPESREALADVAGECCGLQWANHRSLEDPYHAWYLPNSILTTRYGEIWSLYGRFAPLVSLDCAASVKMPARYWLECSTIRPTLKTGYVKVLWHIGERTFDYTHPDDFPAAFCAARVYANLRDKEAV